MRDNFSHAIERTCPVNTNSVFMMFTYVQQAIMINPTLSSLLNSKALNLPWEDLSRNFQNDFLFYNFIGFQEDPETT